MIYGVVRNLDLQLMVEAESPEEAYEKADPVFVEFTQAGRRATGDTNLELDLCDTSVWDPEDDDACQSLFEVDH